MERPPEDDADEPLVKTAKRAGKILGWIFMGYLIYSLGRLAKLW